MFLVIVVHVHLCNLYFLFDFIVYVIELLHRIYFRLILPSGVVDDLH